MVELTPPPDLAQALQSLGPPPEPAPDPGPQEERREQPGPPDSNQPRPPPGQPGGGLRPPSGPPPRRQPGRGRDPLGQPVHDPFARRPPVPPAPPNVTPPLGSPTPPGGGFPLPPGLGGGGHQPTPEEPFITAPSAGFEPPHPGGTGPGHPHHPNTPPHGHPGPTPPPPRFFPMPGGQGTILQDGQGGIFWDFDGDGQPDARYGPNGVAISLDTGLPIPNPLMPDQPTPPLPPGAPGFVPPTTGGAGPTNLGPPTGAAPPIPGSGFSPPGSGLPLPPSRQQFQQTQTPGGSSMDDFLRLIQALGGQQGGTQPGFDPAAVREETLSRQRDINAQASQQIGRTRADFSRRGVLNSGFARDAEVDIFANQFRALGASNAQQTLAAENAAGNAANRQLQLFRTLFSGIPGFGG